MLCVSGTLRAPGFEGEEESTLEGLCRRHESLAQLLSGGLVLASSLWLSGRESGGLVCFRSRGARTEHRGR